MRESEHDSVSNRATPAVGDEAEEPPSRTNRARRTRAVMVAVALGAAPPWLVLTATRDEGIPFVLLFGLSLYVLAPVYLAVAYVLWRLARRVLRAVEAPGAGAVAGLAIAALLGTIAHGIGDMMIHGPYRSSHGAGWILTAPEVWAWRCGVMSVAGAVACGVAVTIPRRRRAAWAGVGVLVGACLVLVLNTAALERYQMRHLVQLELAGLGDGLAVVDGGGWEPARVDESGVLTYTDDAGQEAHLRRSGAGIRDGCERVECERHGNVLVVPDEDGAGEEARVALDGETTIVVTSDADPRMVGRHVREGTPEDRTELAETLSGGDLLRP